RRERMGWDLQAGKPRRATTEYTEYTEKRQKRRERTGRISGAPAATVSFSPLFFSILLSHPFFSFSSFFFPFIPCIPWWSSSFLLRHVQVERLGVVGDRLLVERRGGADDQVAAAAGLRVLGDLHHQFRVALAGRNHHLVGAEALDIARHDQLHL